MSQRKVRCPDRAKNVPGNKLNGFYRSLIDSRYFLRTRTGKKRDSTSSSEQLNLRLFGQKKISSLNVFRGKISTFNKLDSKLVSHISGWLEPRLAEAPENTQPQKSRHFFC